jgi:Tetratricopeptide repeat
MRPFRRRPSSQEPQTPRVPVIAASALTSTNNAAVDLCALGEYQRACALDEDILTRYRRVLGDDHPHTLASADRLVVDLRTG